MKVLAEGREGGLRWRLLASGELESYHGGEWHQAGRLARESALLELGKRYRLELLRKEDRRLELEQERRRRRIRARRNS